MAYNFYGTFTRAQWQDFKDFTSVQRGEIEARIRWVKAELARVGQVSCTYYDDGSPASFTASPNTYIGKLLLAYRMLGGVPEHDMLLKTRDQVVFLQRGADEYDAPMYTNGRMNRGSQRFDRSLGIAVDSLKKWQLESIKTKREILEFKIKRAMDYADQLLSESDALSGLVDGFAVDDQTMKVELTMMEPGRANVPPGQGDRHGLKIGVIGDPTMTDAQEAAVEGSQRIGG